MIRQLITLMTIIALLSAGCHHAFAQKAEIIKFRTIGFPPYGIHNDGQPSGIYYDLANILATRAGYQINNQIAPYARIKSKLKSGEIDMTLMFKYKDLDEHVIYVAPFPSLKIVIIGIKGTTFDAPNSLKGKRIAYLRGAEFNSAIEISNDPEIIIYRTTDFPQSVKLLMAERVDAIIGPMEPILGAAADMNKGLENFGKPLILAEQTPWLQVSKKSRHRRAAGKFKTAFEQINKDGTFEKVYKQYLHVQEKSACPQLQSINCRVPCI